MQTRGTRASITIRYGTGANYRAGTQFSRFCGKRNELRKIEVQIHARVGSPNHFAIHSAFKRNREFPSIPSRAHLIGRNRYRGKRRGRFRGQKSESLRQFGRYEITQTDVVDDEKKFDVTDSVLWRRSHWVFYLYHASERRIRVIGPPAGSVDIEVDTPPFRILWMDLIDQFVEAKKMSYTDDTTLDDLEVDFWGALFDTPDVRFDPDATCHSPWFEKCCGEKRTFADLKKRGDLDDIYLKIVPRKTINCPAVSNLTDKNALDPASAEPTNVRVSHLDMDKLLVELLHTVDYSAVLAAGRKHVTPGILTGSPPPADPAVDFLPVMLLLKV